jgi:hypothetical protein
MYNSLINFILPGNPEKRTQPNKIKVPKLGVMCNIPFISTIFLELNRLLIQSTKKKKIDDKKACVTQNKTPPYINNISPQQKTK